jgi:hypothetical protein
VDPRKRRGKGSIIGLPAGIITQVPRGKTKPSPFSFVVRSILAAKEVAPSEMALRKGYLDMEEWRYIEAIYDFYFMLETLYGNGKTKNVDVQREFLASPILVACTEKELSDPENIDLFTNPLVFAPEVTEVSNSLWEQRKRESPVSTGSRDSHNLPPREFPPESKDKMHKRLSDFFQAVGTGRPATLILTTDGTHYTIIDSLYPLPPSYLKQWNEDSHNSELDLWAD